MCVNGEGAKIGKLTGSPTVVTWAGDQSQSQSRTLTSAGHTFQHTLDKKATTTTATTTTNKQKKKKRNTHKKKSKTINKSTNPRTLAGSFSCKIQDLFIPYIFSGRELGPVK